jgi:hypothetical protein
MLKNSKHLALECMARVDSNRAIQHRFSTALVHNKTELIRIQVALEDYFLVALRQQHSRISQAWEIYLHQILTNLMGFSSSNRRLPSLVVCSSLS